MPARSSIVFVVFNSIRQFFQCPVKLLEAPLDVLQPFVDIFPLELYFGAALRTRKGRAVAEMTESRF